MHGASESRLRPSADAGLRIGRDVGRIDHAERSRHGVAAGELFAALRRVTGRAVAATRERFAPGDQLRCEAAWSRQRDRSDGRPPRQRAKASEPETSESNDRDEQLLDHGVLRRPVIACVKSDYAEPADNVNEVWQKTANCCEGSHLLPRPRAENRASAPWPLPEFGLLNLRAPAVFLNLGSCAMGERPSRRMEARSELVSILPDGRAQARATSSG